MQETLDALKSLLATVEDLRAAADVLEWDQETYMPPGAAAARAAQISTLRRLAHERFTADEVGDLLERLGPEVEHLDEDALPSALVRVTRRDYDKARRLPSRLVAELAEAVSRAKEAWKRAKADDHFPTFAPHLQRLVDLNREKAEALGYDDRLYDALLDAYEPGLRTSGLEGVFATLREELVPLVSAIGAQEPPEDDFLHGHFPRAKQWAFGMETIQAFGYDLERGRQDESAHPFTTSFHVSDVRITTRIDETRLAPALFGTMHEAGHALYEQGLAPALARTPLADGTSLGMHESQSRLWEVMVGRSRPFWQHAYPRLQHAFPDALADVPLDDFYRAINRVQPSPIRIYADDLTYNLHIMLRFDLEVALFGGEARVDELPARWNDALETYLGLRPRNDAEGLLQDIHWSLGAFGYFPTYALGNLMAAQVWEAARRDLTDLEGQIRTGRFEPLLGWLRQHVHRYGRTLEAGQILERATGRGLDAQPWLRFVREKYGAIYEAA